MNSNTPSLPKQMWRAAHRVYNHAKGQPPFAYALNYPPQEANFYDLNKPISGWISSSLPVKEFRMKCGSKEDNSVNKVVRKDVENALGGKYKNHIGFESSLTVKDCINAQEKANIILSIDFESAPKEEIDIPIKSYIPNKNIKREKIIPFLACPECHSKLESKDETLLCSSCDISFSIKNDSISFLTDKDTEEFSIKETDNVSSWGYDHNILDIIKEKPDGMFLDCGAGFRTEEYPNIINFEIFNYPSTDIVGIGEKLPFASESLDGVFSVAVLEHVKDPFQCAKEIIRVLKPGGALFCSAAFLQPVHAYPHHYYNMTSQGLVNLFDEMDIHKTHVEPALHPMMGIKRILFEYALGLPEELRDTFVNMSIQDIIDFPDVEEWYKQHVPLIHDLEKKKWTDLASGTSILAYKKG